MADEELLPKEEERHHSRKRREGRDKDKKKEKKRRRHTKKDDHDVDDAKDRKRNRPSEKAGTDDYYRLSGEFRRWLKEEQSIFLDEISTETARKIFRQFCDVYNDGKLDQEYYSGDLERRPDASERTRHQWSFAGKLTEEERLQVASVADRVDTLTKGDS